ncbi:hypothetical protein [Pseudoalteromonas aurantia]|uniref:PilZ domain-containing protein n=1 Tax=Pseudoalteromonas aurantia 208 TaxID=1314867 RepID=A0ABR9EIE2_9GAMM|nr:hypothetical protein [Pseudoalteromonas aurantia]MBE0370785.1 hypothetical protein [Pseudoalteromonas aurantia 208]
MKLTSEESNFITQVLQQDSTAQLDIQLSDIETAQLQQWLTTLTQASDLQLLAKINSQIMYFPAHIETKGKNNPTFSCGLPSIFDTNSNHRHWRTEKLTGVQLRATKLGFSFKVLSLSLSGLVIRTFPYNATKLAEYLDYSKVTLILSQGNIAKFDVTSNRVINDTAIALEIMNIHDGLMHLKQEIFEYYNQVHPE